MNTKGGKKEKTQMEERTRVGVPTPVLIVTQGVLSGRQE